MKGDKLLHRVLAKDYGSDEGRLLNNLLREFFDGYPLDNLRQLLRSSDAKTVANGAWIAQELGVSGKPLFDDLAPLLDHASWSVRYEALSAMLLCCSASEGATLAKIVSLLSDPQREVRYAATNFVRRAYVEQVKSALAYLEATGNAESEYVVGLRSLLDPQLHKTEHILTLLRSASPTLRKFAVAAAVRMCRPADEPLQVIEGADDLPLRVATASNDREIQEFAQFELESLERDRRSAEREKMRKQKKSPPSGNQPN